MTNKITLRGVIKNIRFSHNIQDVVYDRADLVVPRSDGKEDVINLKFKKFANTYAENDEVECVGNIRSYSTQHEDGKNKVEIYVFTYMDKPEQTEEGVTNTCELEGRICKIDGLRETNSGKQNIHFILANNIISADGQKLNSYIPCIAWGNVAKRLAELSVNSRIVINGQLHSREYKKVVESGDVEIRVAHECFVSDFSIVESDGI